MVPVDVLTAVVSAVHVGGRVAVHTQQAAGGAAAVAAGVDSVEHGMCLDPSLLAKMAEQGTVLTPTLTVIQAGLPGARRRPDGPRKEWYLGGAEAHGGLVAAAAAAGMRPHDALAAASWAARAYLGLPGLEPGAPADAADPRVDLT